MKLIGLTGGIACGKSTISEYLAKKGVPIIDADAIARQVLEPGTAGYRRILELASRSVLVDDWQGSDESKRPLDRKKVRQFFFDQPELKRQLERITHPATLRKMVLELARCFFGCSPVVVLDVPLLFETKMDRFCSQVVVVWVETEQQLRRLMLRDPSLRDNEAEARKLIDLQMPIQQKLARANVVIDNSEEVDQLYRQLDSLYEQMLKPTASRRLFAVVVVGALVFVPLALVLLLITWAAS